MPKSGIFFFGTSLVMQPTRSNPFANAPPQASGAGGFAPPTSYQNQGQPPQFTEYGGYGAQQIPQQPPPYGGMPVPGSSYQNAPPPMQQGGYSQSMAPPPSMGQPAGPYGQSAPPSMGQPAGAYGQAAPPSMGQPAGPYGQSVPPSMAPPQYGQSVGYAPQVRLAHPDMMGGQPMHQTPHIDASLEASLKESDEFNSPPHYVRGSFSRLPNSHGLASKVRGPMGFVFQPLGPVPSGYPEPPTVNFSAVGSIVRCRRCRIYMNPFVTWESSGRRWTCNSCGFSNETLNTYFGPLDSTGRRADRYEHPELCSGSVDYVAPAEYMVRPPQPAAFLFLIDVTSTAMNSGMVDVVTSTIRELITERKFPGGERCQIGIMTFDTTIHFYNVTLKNPQMIVVNDFEEMFVPIAEEVLVPLYENEASIITLLDSIPRMNRSNKSAESCLGSAVKAASLAMKHIGGKLVICASTIPSVGELGLTSRKDNSKLLNTDREIELLKPSIEGYRELATELTKVQICCELFLATNMYMDVASIAPLAKHTAGDLRYYSNFHSSGPQGEKLSKELAHVCSRPMGWEAVMRVRVSRGWKISKFFGHLFVRGVDLLVVPNCHSDQTFGITIEPVENEAADPNIGIQFALLYTNSEGERRIRVHTIQCVSSPNLNEIYATMDPEVMAALCAQVAMEESLKLNLSAGRNYLHSTCQQIASVAASGSDCVPNLAMYILGILKSEIFRATNDVAPDLRVYQWSRFENIPLPLQTACMYPRMYGLHNIEGEEGIMDQVTGRIVLPAQLPLSVDQMTQDGLYLIENGEVMLLWIGTAVSPDVLFNVFGVSAINQLNPETSEQAIGHTGKALSVKIGAILNQLRQDRVPPYMTLEILPHEHPASGKFFQQLVEDRTAGMQMTYPEFLQRLGVAAPGAAAPTPPPSMGGGMLPPAYR